MKIKTTSTAELTLEQIQEAISRYLKEETGTEPESIKFVITAESGRYDDYAPYKPPALGGAICELKGHPNPGIY